uniref:Uncharacterized protein n=1 Tax=Aegilops tauschii subsp. strangulata TaxID=200361 RepID=A0A453C5X4_AEGTS
PAPSMSAATRLPPFFLSDATSFALCLRWWAFAVHRVDLSGSFLHRILHHRRLQHFLYGSMRRRRRKMAGIGVESGGMVEERIEKGGFAVETV